MTGRLALKTKIDIPPLAGKVREKLVLDGRFEVLEGKFLHSTIQNQIDNLSQRAQGQPGEPRRRTGSLAHERGFSYGERRHPLQQIDRLDCPGRISIWPAITAWIATP